MARWRQAWPRLLCARRVCLRPPVLPVSAAATVVSAAAMLCWYCLVRPSCLRRNVSRRLSPRSVALRLRAFTRARRAHAQAAAGAWHARAQRKGARRRVRSVLRVCGSTRGASHCFFITPHDAILRHFFFSSSRLRLVYFLFFSLIIDAIFLLLHFFIFDILPVDIYCLVAGHYC